MLKEAEPPPKARADIAGTLVRSLDTTDSPNVEEAWVAEVAFRVADVDTGKVKLLSWDRARRRLRAGLRSARAGG